MGHRSHTELYYHLVWSTCARRPLIDESWEEQLYEMLAKKCLALRCRPIEINGVADHVHVLLRAHTNVSPAAIVHDLKGFSSYSVTRLKLCKTHFDWNERYGAFSVSPRHVENVARYIRNQKRHHGAGGRVKKKWERDEPLSRDGNMEGDCTREAGWTGEFG